MWASPDRNMASVVGSYSEIAFTTPEASAFHQGIVRCLRPVSTSYLKVSQPLSPPLR